MIGPIHSAVLDSADPVARAGFYREPLGARIRGEEGVLPGLGIETAT